MQIQYFIFPGWDEITSSRLLQEEKEKNKYSCAGERRPCKEETVSIYYIGVGLFIG
jgi:hypothetical protein